ncbi:MAG TPA: hypothetical protein VG269_27010 [Tepidisphaeraceae bacterium]|jgi:hypothetical protein|nr:hypothetical protein [Tepidisphaeraceae bacterium]
MTSSPRHFRALLYSLKEAEAKLRTTGRTEAADDLARAVRLLDSGDAADFLADSRAVLESVLLGERNPPTELVSVVLETIAQVDEKLREASAHDRG